MITLDLVAHEYKTDTFASEMISAIKEYQQFSIPFTANLKGSGTYINLPFSFDIEVTSFKDNAGQKCAIPYIWQFGLYNHVWYGREINEFVEITKNLSEILSSAFSKCYSKKEYKTKKNYTVVIYVHNLSYEFQFLYKELDINSEKFFLARTKRDVIKFRLNQKNNISVEFRCSYMLTGLSLANCCKTFTRDITKLFEQKDENGNIIRFDYTKIRSPVTKLDKYELNYALYDVYCTNEIIHEKFECGELFSDIPLTATGYTRQKFKRAIKVHDDPNYKEIMNCTHIVSVPYYTLYKQCYQGGFTHSNYMRSETLHTDVTHYDITSSYPTVLISEMYPRERFKPVFMAHNIEEVFSENFVVDCESYKTIYPDVDISDLTTAKDFVNTPVSELRERNLGYLIRVKISYAELKSDVYDCPISISKIVNYGKDFKVTRKFNGRLISGHNIELYLTDVDFEIIKKAYNLTETRILGLWYSIFDYLPYEMISTVLELYEQKTKFKGKDEKLYSHYKALLNSVYGMCVTDPLKEDYKFSVEGIYNEYERMNEREKNASVIDKLHKYNRDHFLFYLWGVYCSAYARNNLFKAIFELKEDYLYSDTDSVFLKHNERHIKFFENYDKDIKEKLESNKHIKFNSELLKKLNATDEKGKQYPLGVWTKETDKDKDHVKNEKLKNAQIDFVTIGAKRYLQVFRERNTKEFIKFKCTFAGVKPRELEGALWNQSGHNIETVIPIAES